MPFFQPLIDLSTQDIVGFEALARWRAADGSMLDAENFIEAAERTGLVGPLTLSIMEQAMKEARDWPAQSQTRRQRLSDPVPRPDACRADPEATVVNGLSGQSA